VDRAAFLDRLRQSRLLGDERLAVAAARLDEGATDQAVLEGLVGQGALTPYQARRIWAGKGQGLVLGQYRVLDELGRGGFGQVYKALHTVMDRVVALKVIAPELVENERARTWFKREVLAVTQLCHPNIVMAYDANEADDTLFLVMEYVDGSNLDALVRKQGPLSIGLTCEMMRQAARALQHAHDKGLVHRDIKPANLLIPAAALAESPAAPANAPVVIKVVDFGLARLQQTTQAATLMLQNEKSFLGTPDYISPEQAQNVHAVDIRSDLYSLGCSFYHALTGRRPFRGATVLETVVKHLKEDAEPLEAVRPEAPAGLCALVRRLMAKEPARRFQTPAELIAELDFLCGREAARPGASRPAFKPISRPLPRRPAPASTGTDVVPGLASGAGPSAAQAVAEAELARTAVTPMPDGLPQLGGPISPSEAAAATPVPPAADTSPEKPPPSPAEIARLDVALRKAWQRWTAVVEAFARGSLRAQVNAEAYKLLHAQLLEVCRAQAEAAEGPQRAAFQRLEAIAEPWLTPQSLAAADRETLASLLQRCKEVERDLGVDGGAHLWALAAVLAALAVAALLGWQLYQLQRASLSPVSWWEALKRLVMANPVLWTLLALPAVVLGSIALLARRLRT
jgi:serine/threonine-protein kinase